MKHEGIEINRLEDLELANSRSLGEGYISEVKLCKHRQTGKKFALKIVI